MTMITTPSPVVRTIANGTSRLPDPGKGFVVADLGGLGTIELWMVDADLAANRLTHNTHNRNPKPRHIARYAADMRIDDWQWTGQPVRFAIDGALLDGQNRLHAIIEADACIPLLVIRGLPNKAQRDMDNGAPRLLHDVLKLEGETNASALAALVRMVEGWESGLRRGLGSQPSSHASALRVLEAHPELRELCTSARSIADGCGLPASLVGLVWWLTAQIDAEDAEFFMQRLGDGQGLVKGDPIYELRRTIADSRTNRGQRSKTFLLAITIKAWNFYRNGETVALYRWRPGGANPETFPEPV